MEGVSKQASLERGWCFGSAAFREKMSHLVGEKVAHLGTTSESKANGYGGEQLRDHAEASAKVFIEKGLSIFGLAQSELTQLGKTDWRKAMIVRLIRSNTSVKLDWIRDELNMGVRSGIGRAEELLVAKLKDDKDVQGAWAKFNK